MEELSDLVRSINDSDAFREAASGWGDGFNGNVLMVFEPDDQRADPLNVLLRLSPGICNGAELVEGSGHPDAGFVFTAARTVWRTMLDGSLAPASAVLYGRLRVQGDRGLLFRHASLAGALVDCVKRSGLEI